jgi:hypothetical protein
MSRLPLALSPLLVAALAVGCKDRACFQWGADEGACPAQDEALAFMTPSCDELIVESIDGEGEREDGLCCYDVTKYEDQGVYVCAAAGRGIE